MRYKVIRQMLVYRRYLLEEILRHLYGIVLFGVLLDYLDRGYLLRYQSYQNERLK